MRYKKFTLVCFFCLVFSLKKLFCVNFRWFQYCYPESENFIFYFYLFFVFLRFIVKEILFVFRVYGRIFFVVIYIAYFFARFTHTSVKWPRCAMCKVMFLCRRGFFFSRFSPLGLKMRKIFFNFSFFVSDSFIIF